MPRQPAQSNPQALLHGHLLLVDDDALITATIATAFRRAQYEVDVSTSAEAALALCRDRSFDLAIIDERMPGMSGTQLATRLRQEFKVPIAFLSAYHDTELVDAADAVGALGFFVKPLDPLHMLPAIKTILGRARELASLEESEARLLSTVKTERIINTAVGVLMVRLECTRAQAFDALRAYARSERLTIIKVSEALLGMHDGARDILNKIGKHAPGAKPR